MVKRRTEDLERAKEELESFAYTVSHDIRTPLITIAGFSSWGDEVRIKEVFENLVGNAIQYMGNQEHPKIEVGAQDAGEFYQFYVKDNGIGTAQEDIERVFKIFERVGEIKIEGTGIGLAIVKKVVEHHGGHIWVDSKKGEGSTFYFTIPHKQVSKKEEVKK